MSNDIPALEGAPSDGMLGGMSIPRGMTRRAMSYDDSLEGPMAPLPSDINISNLWRRPVIPDRKFQRLTEEDETGSELTHAVDAEAAKPQVPVVKAKASVLMNSLITKQTQENIHRFEKQAGLTDTGYSPHKGLVDETHYHRMADSIHKLHMHNTDLKEEKQTSSTQSTPTTTPQHSPKQKRRSWFSSQSSAGSITSSEFSTSSSSSVDLGAGEGGSVERWSFFGPRPPVQKTAIDPGAEPSTAAGFALQPYKGAQKPTPMEVMKAQATRLAEDPANLKAPKMEIPTMDGKRQTTRPHKLKHRDMNVLTPSGF
ncbi:putative monooxygenase p33MONOX [Clupea harengus]|uniref:Putative monooxygenase p33MONOX n=1 Tax=Clupea harengus TaxID=7950 RepID=A0A6P3VQA0_CLUHA|nr:putative monooxygenase p33MONOX [Clupea harengus]